MRGGLPLAAARHFSVSYLAFFRMIKEIWLFSERSCRRLRQFRDYGFYFGQLP